MIPGLVTFPTADVLDHYSANTPDFMRPNTVPYAAILPGYLEESECDAIQTTLSRVDPYTFSKCGAVTREVVAAPVLDPIEFAARCLNRIYWDYDIDPGQHSWMQTYEAGGEYRRHMDGSPGQMRKLTAVALLSDESTYEGGNLTLYVPPQSLSIPRTRGTVVVFQHWVDHDVSPVTKGLRQTINMGFWGPNFR